MIKNALTAFIPESFKLKWRTDRSNRDWVRLVEGWRKARAQVGAGPTFEKTPRILIFPSDLGSITGALGDDAMITATIEQFEAKLGNIGVDVFSAPGAAELVRARGFSQIDLPDMGQFPAKLNRHFADRYYDAVVVLGADILDGYYNPTAALLRLICADMAARNGIPITILGGSFNARPPAKLRQVFETLHPNVKLHVRDEISLKRLKQFAKVNAQLVADCAFCLKPGTASPEAVAWIEAEHARGRKVIGMNVHPMLIKNASKSEIDQIIGSCIKAATTAAIQSEISWVMIPHDYRGERGDGRCLKPIFDALTGEGSVPCFYLEGEHRAADLKALAGHTDGVMTGRMHLAIAALGMGVPTLSLTYQDKFEGLYRHFQLPDSLLLSPDIFDDVGQFSSSIVSFAQDLPSLKATVTDQNASVLRLAAQNFELV